MRYIFLTILALAFVRSSAQIDSAKNIPSALIKISPFQFIAQTFELSVEALNRRHNKSFEISGGYRSGHADYANATGGSLSLAYRKYARPLSTPLKNNMDEHQGIYYSLFVKTEWFKGTEAPFGSSTDTKAKILSFSPGFALGLQRTIFEVLLIDIYLGGGIKFPNVTYESGTSSDDVRYDLLSPGYEGIYPVVAVKLGLGL